MTWTSSNDINVLQASDASIVGAGNGDDIYIVSPFTMSPGQEITLSDANGTNTLQLIDGVTIASSMVASNALRLTLSNDAIITILDADQFNFNVGGNVITGDSGQDKSFEDFVIQDLGTAVPEGGGFNFGGEVTIGSQPVQDDEVSVDIGVLGDPEALDASGDGFVFADDANLVTNVEISNFSSDDVIQIANADPGDYSFEHDGSNMNIIYNNDGIINDISLIGVVSPEDLLYTEGLFEAFLGFDAVTYV